MKVHKPHMPFAAVFVRFRGRLALFARGHGGRSFRKFDRPSGGDDAVFRGHLVEKAQAFELLFVQIELNILAQIFFEWTRW